VCPTIVHSAFKPETAADRKAVSRAGHSFDSHQHFDIIGNMNEKAAVAALAALAQEARLRVFRALVGAGLEGMTPSALAAMLDIPSSTLSFHLKELVHANLVSVERDGRNLHYRPSLGQMNELLGYLTDHCCMGTSCTPRGSKRQIVC
jgi:ArsR family transcriptional regulator, arsenate/arsenite/antimonite-responsive transcriptional repressor